MKTYRIKVIIGEIEAKDVEKAYKKAVKFKKKLLWFPESRIVSVVEHAEVHLEER